MSHSNSYFHVLSQNGRKAPQYGVGMLEVIIVFLENLEAMTSVSMININSQRVQTPSTLSPMVWAILKSPSC